MIKIEFKEAQRLLTNDHYPNCIGKSIYKDDKYITTLFRFIPIKQITFGLPSELVPDRSEILKQLGISQQEDEQNQIKWSKL